MAAPNEVARPCIDLTQDDNENKQIPPQSAFTFELTVNGYVQVKDHGQVLAISRAPVPDTFLTDGGIRLLSQLHKFINDISRGSATLSNFFQPPFQVDVYSKNDDERMSLCGLSILFWPEEYAVQLFQECFRYGTELQYKAITPELLDFILDCGRCKVFLHLTIKKVNLTEIQAWKLLKAVISVVYPSRDEAEPLEEEKAPSLDIGNLEVKAFFNQDDGKVIATLACANTTRSFFANGQSPLFDSLVDLSSTSGEPVPLKFTVSSPEHAVSMLELIEVLSTSDMEKNKTHFDSILPILEQHPGALENMRKLADHMLLNKNMPQALTDISSMLALIFSKPRKSGHPKYTKKDFDLIKYLYDDCERQPFQSTCTSFFNVISWFQVSPEEMVTFLRRVLHNPHSNNVVFATPKSLEELMLLDDSKQELNEEKDAPDVDSDESDNETRKRKAASDDASSRKRQKHSSPSNRMTLLKAVISKLLKELQVLYFFLCVVDFFLCLFFFV